MLTINVNPKSLRHTPHSPGIKWIQKKNGIHNNVHTSILTHAPLTGRRRIYKSAILLLWLVDGLLLCRKYWLFFNARGGYEFVLSEALQPFCDAMTRVAELKTSRFNNNFTISQRGNHHATQRRRRRWSYCLPSWMRGLNTQSIEY